MGGSRIESGAKPPWGLLVSGSSIHMKVGGMDVRRQNNEGGGQGKSSVDLGVSRGNILSQ